MTLEIIGEPSGTHHLLREQRTFKWPGTELLGGLPATIQRRWQHVPLRLILRVRLLAATVLAATSACVQPVNTVPSPVSPTAAVQYYDLDVPADVEIRTVDFAATTFTETSGAPGGAVGSAVGGRAFVKVYAVRKGTGEQLLLLYEDIGRRRQPVQIIRFHAGGVRASPDSAR